MKFNKNIGLLLIISIIVCIALVFIDKSVQAQTYNSAWARQKPFIVMFYTSWCPACKSAKPLYNNIKMKHGSRINFVSVDLDKSPALQQKYGVRMVPTFLLINPKNSKKQNFNINAFSSEEMFLDQLYRGLQGIK
jgi:thiol-disulfide isomerase/thioredoxin